MRLVDDLLDVSRIRNGKIVLQIAPTQLDSVIKTAIDSSRPQIDQLGHRITVNTASNPITVHADATRLSQIISNLLTNAAKYTPPGGHIELTTSVEDSFAVIRVKDNGVGIPASMLQKIFEMFTQVDESLSRSQGGLGIGLMLVKHLVDMHHGSVSASSEGEGKGSEFEVRIPLSHQPNPQNDASATHPESGLGGSEIAHGASHEPIAPVKGKRILVVDDTRAAAMMLQKLLETLGNEVVTTHSVESALELIEQRMPEIIFSDIAMPGLSGYDFAKIVRQTYPGNQPLMVAVTGYGQENDKQLATEAGFNHHVVKPVSIDNLKRLMQASQ